MNNHSLGAITDTRESVLEATQLLDTASIWLEDVPEASAEWRKIKTALQMLEEVGDSLYQKEHGFEGSKTCDKSWEVGEPYHGVTKVCRHCNVVFKRADEAPIPKDRCERCHEEIEALKGWKPSRLERAVSRLIGVVVG